MSAAPIPRSHKVTAHQPIYLGGYLGHFAKLAWCDEWIVFDVCPMESSGFENRNRIRAQSGELMLTVPVLRARETPLSDLRIANEHGWQRKHWRSLEMAYAKAPYWDTYSKGLKAFYEQRWDLLIDLDEAMFRWCASHLELFRPIRRASIMGATGSKSALVLDMAVKAHATEYLFGPQGISYADVPSFTKAGVTARFQNFTHPEYPQMGGGFLPNLSVIDLLMNVGPGAAKALSA